MVNETPLDFVFEEGLDHNLEKISDIQARDFRIFGTYDYAEGGGAFAWIGMLRSDRRVYGLDPERETPRFLFNSSAERFILTFNVLNGFLSEGKKLASNIVGELQAVDPEAYPTSEWHLLIDYLKDI